MGFDPALLYEAEVEALLTDGAANDRGAPEPDAST
jgi:hypothetical protein